MKCPQCGLNQRMAWFQPSEHCGSPDVLHDVCVVCQAQQREYWAARLAAYFDELVRYGALAA